MTVILIFWNFKVLLGFFFITVYVYAFTYMYIHVCFTPKDCKKKKKKKSEVSALTLLRVKTLWLNILKLIVRQYLITPRSPYNRRNSYSMYIQYIEYTHPNEEYLLSNTIAALWLTLDTELIRALTGRVLRNVPYLSKHQFQL